MEPPTCVLRQAVILSRCGMFCAIILGERLSWSRSPAAFIEDSSPADTGAHAHAPAVMPPCLRDVTAARRVGIAAVSAGAVARGAARALHGDPMAVAPSVRDDGAAAACRKILRHVGSRRGGSLCRGEGDASSGSKCRDEGPTENLVHETSTGFTQIHKARTTQRVPETRR